MRPRTLICLLALAACGCPGGKGEAPFLRRVSSEAAVAHAPMAARVSWSHAPPEKEAYPEGTRHVVVKLELGGLAFNHQEHHVPAGKDADRRWDFAKVALPDGTTLIGDSLNWHSGNRGYSPWSFLGVAGRPRGASKLVDLLKPSVCVAAAAFETQDSASAELVFDRPLAADHTVRTAARLTRRAGDPWVYLQLCVEPDGAAVEHVSIGGFPNTTHPIFYGLRTQWPRNASFLVRERWVWAAGRDWNMHARDEKHEAAVAADAPGGVLFYNRRNSRTGGMMAVFLPEQVATVQAAGTYGVRVSFRPRKPVLRLALREWYDWRGWEPVRETFLAELPEAVARLRAMSFAWPLTDLLGADARRAEALLAAPLDEAGRKRLADAWEAYRAALASVAATPLADSPERYAAERAAVVAAERVRQAMAPLTREWLSKGGCFPPERQ